MHDAVFSALMAGDYPRRTLEDYLQWVLNHGQHERACNMLEKAVRQHPRHFNALGLYIARCLEAGCNREALAAVQCLLAYARPEGDLLDAALAVYRRLQPQPPLEKEKTALCLCMIVRNEADHLGRCLHSVRDLVDDRVIVDTGSSDRTRDVARIYGARVFDFSWCDDFSKARNAALDQACGKWILVLDADEVIAPQDTQALKSLLARDERQPVAYALTTRNYCHTVNDLGWHPNEGRYGDLEAGLGWFPSTKVRLFRNQPAIRFHFPVHERVEPALRSAGHEIRSCPAPIHHYGHLNAVQNRQKALKYYRLGHAKLNLMAHDPGAIRELAVQAGQLEQWSQAFALWNRLLELRPDYGEAMINLAGACWNLEDYHQSLLWAQKAVQQDGSVKEGPFNLGVSLLLLGRFDEARAVLESLSQAHPGYLAAGFMLAATYACLQLGEHARKIWAVLERSPAGKALPMALDDLVQRMARAGNAEASQNMTVVLGKASSRQA